MKVYEATERAYKNGYEKGFADGKMNNFTEIHGGKNVTQKAIFMLIELLRVFINAPYRPKADATVLEAKLDDLKKELERELNSEVER